MPAAIFVENKTEVMESKFDVASIRKHFPILEQKAYGHPLVYLDNAATTQKPRSVVKRIEEAYFSHNANVHRAVHLLSQQATEAHEAARVVVQQFINAAEPDEIVFTRGTTESINLVAFSFGEAFCREGDEILISSMEHHSNIVPWQLLCERKKMTLKVIPIDDNGCLLVDEYEKLLGPKVKLLAITHVSNVLGIENPIKQIIEKAHKQGVPVLVDGAQAVAHMPVDVRALDADFYTFSSHKVFGPTGVGVLYAKRSFLEQMPPYQGGGEMIDQVHFEKTTYNRIPFKFEAGTPDFIGTAALAEALRFIQEIGLDKIADYEKQLVNYALQELSKVEGFQLLGNIPERHAIIPFQLKGIHAYDVGLLLDKLGIAVRTGHHCAQPLMERLAVDSCVRASFAFYNTSSEVDRLQAALKKIYKMFN